MLMTAAFWIAVLGILLIATSVYITVLRIGAKVFHGDEGDGPLARARRANYTVLEFGLPFAILVLAYENLVGSQPWIMWLSAVFIVGRLLHMFYMYRLDGPHPLRGIGAVASHAANAGLIVLILMRLA